LDLGFWAFCDDALIGLGANYILVCREFCEEGEIGTKTANKSLGGGVAFEQRKQRRAVKNGTIS
jgi:hypothetical protein